MLDDMTWSWYEECIGLGSLSSCTSDSKESDDIRSEFSDSVG